MDKNDSSDLAYTGAALLVGLAIAHITRPQREAAAPPPARSSWRSWGEWAFPLALAGLRAGSLWQEVSAPARRRKSDAERVRRVATLGSTLAGLASAAFLRGPALTLGQALTLVQSASAAAKDAASNKRARVPVIAILPLVAWFGYANGRLTQRALAERGVHPDRLLPPSE